MFDKSLPIKNSAEIVVNFFLTSVNWFFATCKLAVVKKSQVKLFIATFCNGFIVTMQDLLELDEAARMNFPSTLGGNWSWRMTEDQLTPAVEENLLDLTTIIAESMKIW